MIIELFIRVRRGVTFVRGYREPPMAACLPTIPPIHASWLTLDDANGGGGVRSQPESVVSIKVALNRCETLAARSA